MGPHSILLMLHITFIYICFTVKGCVCLWVRPCAFIISVQWDKFNIDFSYFILNKKNLYYTFFSSRIYRVRIYNEVQMIILPHRLIPLLWLDFLGRNKNKGKIMYILFDIWHDPGNYCFPDCFRTWQRHKSLPNVWDTHIYLVVSRIEDQYFEIR